VRNICKLNRMMIPLSNPQQKCTHLK